MVLHPTLRSLSQNNSDFVSTHSHGTKSDSNNSGYGMGLILSKAFDSLAEAWQKVWTHKSSAKELAKQNAPRNYPMKRTLQQASAFPAVFDLSTLTGQNGFVVNGLTTRDRLGFAVNTAGDFNGDGLEDLVLGAYGTLPAGSVYVLFGQKSGWLPIFNLSSLNGLNGFAINGIATGDELGSSVSTAGDFNGDGTDDLVLGAYYATREGHTAAGCVSVLFGKTSGWPPIFDLTTLNGPNGFTINGLDAYGFFGWTVSRAGDINEDGSDDLILGNYVLFGKTNGWPAIFNLTTLNGSNGFSIQGDAYTSVLDVTTSGAGDFNGDGKDDFVLGLGGNVSIIFGHANSWPAVFNVSTLNGSNGFNINDLGLGISVSSGGDINRDGYADLVFGRTLTDSVYVLFGGTSSWPATFNMSTLNGLNGFTINGLNTGRSLGSCVNSAGDMNGDGYADLVIAAETASPGGFNQAGSVYVLFGQANGWSANFNLSTLDGSNGFTINGRTPYIGLGSSVSTAGDINGDKLSDLILGAPRVTPSTSPGIVYIIFGKNSSSTLIPSTTLNPSPIAINTPITAPSSTLSSSQPPQLLSPLISPSPGTAANVSVSSRSHPETIGIAAAVSGVVLLGALGSVIGFLRLKKKACFADKSKDISEESIPLENLEQGQDSSLLIPKVSLVIQKKIAEGSFGNVYLGTYRNREVAIKQLKSHLSEQIKQNLFEEVKIMARLRSPYVVPFYGVTNEEPYMIVMQYMKGGSLRDFLRKAAPKSTPWDLRMQFSHDTSQGLAYLHKRKIVHADLKSLNVLLDQDHHALLADFGLATIRKETSEQVAGEIKGSLLWMAPELFDKQPPSFASDVFSLGVVLWEIASHRLPFQEFRWNLNEIAAQIKQGTREKFPEDTPDVYKNLAEKCWDTNPGERPSAEDAAQIFSQLWKKNERLPNPTYPSNPALDPTYLTHTYENSSGTVAGSYVNNAQTKLGF